jgi:hypothetical protein
MSKHKYTPTFEQFWSAYPRKTAKLPAFKSWVKTGVDGDAFLPKQIIQDIEKRTRLKWWPTDTTKIPHAATWINQARWEDEGWEDDIKTGSDRPTNTGRPDFKPRIEDDYGLDRWQQMTNRLMRSYILLHGAFGDVALQTLIKTKNEAYAELKSAVREELDADESKEKRAEMAFLIADTMLSRFDNITGLNLKPRVIDMAQKQRSA